MYDKNVIFCSDPAKQTNIPIQRWQQFTADEVVAKSNILSKGNEILEGGWGDLPPLGLSSGNSSSTINTNTNAASGSNNTFVISHHQMQQQQQQQPTQPHKNNRLASSAAATNANGNAWSNENNAVAVGQSATQGGRLQLLLYINMYIKIKNFI